MGRLPQTICVALLMSIVWPVAAEEFEPGDSVWIQFGDPDQEHGLYRLPWGEPPLLSRGGRYARRTEHDSLWRFRVDPRFLHEPMPVRVVLEYWDEGEDWFVLSYASNDPTGEDRGESKRTYAHYHTDTGTWKQVVFDLPDARFSGNAWNPDFSVCLDNWLGLSRPGVTLSRVEVIKGGIVLTVSPEAVSADGESTAEVQARAYDRCGRPVPDGTQVRFTCTAGGIRPQEATTVGGCAAATFTGGKRPGSVDVTASTGEHSTTVVVPMLDGSGPVHEVTYVLDDFAHPERWRIEDSEDFEGRLQMADVMSYRGRPVARWDYCFKRPMNIPIPMYRTIATPGQVKRLSIWANHDGSGNGLDLHLRDAGGESIRWVLGNLWQRGWRWEWHDLGRPHYGYFDRDFRVSWPITFERINFSRWRKEPDVGQMGTVFFQDLVATCLVPESSLVWPRVELGTRHEEAPGREVPCEVLVHNLDDQPYHDLRLDVAVIDHAGRASVCEETTFSLAPREIKSFEYSFRPKYWGDNTVEARVRGGRIDSIGRDVLAVGPIR